MATIEPASPLHLSSGDRIAIVAGSGRLPTQLALSLIAGGHRPLVVQVLGEGEPGAGVEGTDRATITLETVAELPNLLQRHGVTHAVLAGGIARRPRLSGFRPSFALLALLPRAIRALAGGDDGVLRVIVGTIEARGIKVVGAHEIAPELLAAPGPVGRLSPEKRDWRDIRAAHTAARAIGALDIGQAAISVGGRAVALEGIEGTDGLLERMVPLRAHGRLAGRTRGVLVKCAKPGQEVRADLPSIGPSTIRDAHAAGLAGVAVEAARSLILDRQEVVAEADRLGIFVMGIDPDDLA